MEATQEGSVLQFLVDVLQTRIQDLWNKEFLLINLSLADAKFSVTVLEMCVNWFSLVGDLIGFSCCMKFLLNLSKTLSV